MSAIRPSGPGRPPRTVGSLDARASAPDADTLSPALQPVRAELLSRAAADADRMIADARAEADRIIEQGNEKARQVTERARAAGEAAGASRAAAQQAALQRGLRREVLAAKDDAYQQWRRRAREAVLRLRDEPDYPRRCQTLRDAAAAVLGDDAEVTEHPDGGIVAQLGTRRMDLSLPAIADRALDEVAVNLGELWS